jgi:hypothetical protein
VAYVVQAPYVARPEVAIDGRVIGVLKNGGFVSADVSAGEHSVTIGFDAEPTTRTVAVAPGASFYFEAYDKTRMEGARWLAAGVAAGPGVTNGVRGAIGQVLDEKAEAERRVEGRVWSLDPILPPIALERLRNLAQSE